MEIPFQELKREKEEAEIEWIIIIPDKLELEKKISIFLIF